MERPEDLTGGFDEYSLPGRTVNIASLRCARFGRVLRARATVHANDEPTAVDTTGKVPRLTRLSEAMMRSSQVNE